MKGTSKTLITTFLKNLSILIGLSLLISIILNILVLVVDHHLLEMGNSHQVVAMITKGLVVISSLIFSTIVALRFGSEMRTKFIYFFSSLILVLVLFILPWILLLPLLVNELIFP